MTSTQDVLGLGIESSCDETSVAVVRNGRESLANVIYSQIKEHAPFRGVVPEIASRAHLEKINYVYQGAMEKAGVAPEDLDYVAVTNRPGLTGSLMIGAGFARCLSLVHGVPVIPADHLEAHFYAVRLQDTQMEYPFLGLLLSGGNSAIYRVDGPLKMSVIADTRDDALGEAFDKASSILNLEYPGGPVIERMASTCESRRESLFPPLLKNTSGSEIAFSFSGIKTAVLRAAQAGEEPTRICRDFQASVFELVERMLKRAVRRTGIRRIIASGGVLANGTLRGRLDKIADNDGLTLDYPRERFLCTDNAGMVAALGHELFRAGAAAALDFPVSSKR